MRRVASFGTSRSSQPSLGRDSLHGLRSVADWIVQQHSASGGTAGGVLLNRFSASLPKSLVTKRVRHCRYVPVVVNCRSGSAPLARHWANLVSASMN